MIVDFEEHRPSLGDGVFVADTARVIGRVAVGEESSIWYGTVIRGDVGAITIGAKTNIQDLSMVHVTTNKFDTSIGAEVTVGHRAVLHGCTVEDRVLVGMGAIIMDGCVVESDCLVAAGALISPGTRVPSGSLVVGTPARVVRPLREKERELIAWSAPHYCRLAQKYMSQSGA